MNARTMRTFFLWIPPALLLLAGEWGGRLYAQEGDLAPGSSYLDKLDEERPEVSDEVWQKYLKQIKSLPNYQIARRLQVETVKPELLKWAESLGLEPEVHSFSYLGHLMGAGFATGTLSTESWGPVALVVLDAEKYYRVSPKKLIELNFRYVGSVVLRHPLNEIKSRFTVNGERLLAAVESLCGSEIDYVAGTGAETVFVTLSLRGRSVLECLRLAAAATAHRVEIRDRNVLKNVHDVEVPFELVVETYLSRELLNEIGDLDTLKPLPKIETPLDALKSLIERRAKELENDRKTVLLLPITQPAGTSKKRR